MALLEGWESGGLAFPVPYVDFSGDGGVTDYEKLTVLDAPHRLADAIFRDSLLDGTLFRLSSVGVAITDATPRNATGMFRYSPTSLLFGSGIPRVLEAGWGRSSSAPTYPRSWASTPRSARKSEAALIHSRSRSLQHRTECSTAPTLERCGLTTRCSRDGQQRQPHPRVERQREERGWPAVQNQSRQHRSPP